MTKVKVSNKYQVVIPREIRERLKIQKGQEMLVVARGSMVEMIPERHISELKGFLKGMSTEGIRDEEDRF